MAEVVLQFTEPLPGGDGRTFDVRACARPMDDGRWEGWLEFLPLDGGAALPTPRETTQPNRTDLVYWATGLTRVYLEGALERALAAASAPVRVPAPPVVPATSAPARPAVADVGAPVARAVLDPFAVYAQGEDVLRSELRALSRDHLLAVARSYALLDADGERGSTSLSEAELAARIVAEVRRRAGAA
jgi:hypothetical protein